MTVVLAEGLSKTYLSQEQGSTSALRDLSLSVAAGEVVALLGRSGSGKTTLLNLLAGLDHPTEGRIFVEGNDLAAIGETGRTLLRRRRIGFVFQFFNLLPTLTALENVVLALELAGEGDSSPALEWLRDLGLEGLEGRYPHELSGGEQQRVALARALVKRPAVVLADEPTGNLDTAPGERVLELLVEGRRSLDTALIIATHAPRTVEYADRVLRIVDGTLREETHHGSDR